MQIHFMPERFVLGLRSRALVTVSFADGDGMLAKSHLTGFAVVETLDGSIEVRLGRTLSLHLDSRDPEPLQQLSKAVAAAYRLMLDDHR